MQESRVPGAFVCMATTVVIIGLSMAALAASGDDAQTVKDFEARVAKYIDLRKKDAGSGPRPTSSSDKLAETRKDLQAKAKALRPNAAQGDIFTPRISGYLRRRISRVLRGREGMKIRASLRHAEPVHGIELHVNESYPEGVPLQSTPPTLLLNLPTLPDGLEYRIVERSLVLRDVPPNLIVDFVPNAVPPVEE
jgi:hypothetical protein